MKRLILSGMAMSMLVASSLPGVAVPVVVPGTLKSNVISVQSREPDRKDSRAGNQQPAAQKQVAQPRWKNGQRYDKYRSAAGIKDYSRYGLRRPGPGQQWVRDGSDYLLVGITTGLIASVIVAR